MTTSLVELLEDEISEMISEGASDQDIDKMLADFFED